jgi:phosphoribosylcarboxyaminoimidazole (NCAIR) mutase
MEGIDMAKKLNIARLKELASDIEGLKNTPHMVDHIARLAQEEGLKINLSGGTYTASMAGVRASATAGERAALENWANAARRAVTSAGVL